MKILDNFLTKVSSDKSSIKYKKAKTLFVIVSITFILIFLMMIKNFVSGNINPGIVGVFILSSLIVVLFIIKKGKVLLAGSIVTLAILLVEIFAMITNPIKTIIPYQYYVFFIMILISAMYSPKYILATTYLLVITSTSFWYFQNKSSIPADLQEITQYSFIIYQILILMNFIFSYILTTYVNQAISDLSKKNNKIEKQQQKMVKVAQKLKQNVKEVMQASDMQRTVSEQITESTSEQAATTEEISSSMEQMLITIQSNTQSIDEMYKKSNKSSAKLEKSSKVILQMIDLADDISKKINIISDISNKTDILSINASIEASHAGDYGRGFAIVAQEIRKLADESKLSAKKIKKLSKNSSNISQIARKVLENIIPEIVNNAKVLEKITTANKEQSIGADAINDSIQQLSSTTNQNSASAEEMSYAAEQLSTQAKQLSNAVDILSKI